VKLVESLNNIVNSLRFVLSPVRVVLKTSKVQAKVNNSLLDEIEIQSENVKCKNMRWYVY